MTLAHFVIVKSTKLSNHVLENRAYFEFDQICDVRHAIDSILEISKDHSDVATSHFPLSALPDRLHKLHAFFQK